MKALFVELPAFARNRVHYLSEEEFRHLQDLLLHDPEMGDVIEGTGGLRKLRFGNSRRGKGKRGGLRVIYFWWQTGRQIWLFTLYSKGEVSDLSSADKKVLKQRLKIEIGSRQ
jgi:mRNA-degrading endonuclease RelE of RelBE toxin-antitoxin system